MAGLRSDQIVLSLDTLYNMRVGAGSPEGVREATLTVVGGTVDVYVSDEEPTGTPPATMVKAKAAFSGKDFIGAVPNFMFIEQDTGTTTSIVASGKAIAPVEVV